MNNFSSSEQDQPSCRTSLILVSYNSRAYITNCLKSVLPSLAPGDEVILVDNASTDGSIDGLELAYPILKIVRNSANLGLAAANNQGAQMARGKYLAFINFDTRVEVNWLEALVQALEILPQAGLATAQILLMAPPDVVNASGNDIHLSGLTLCRQAGQKQSISSQAEEVSAVSGAAFVIRRELFQAIGGFDEDFFMYMEETDLSLRARLAGYRCYVVPQAIVYHDYQLRFRPQKTFFQERNRYQMMVKSLHWGSLLMLSPILLLAELITWGFILTRQRKQWREKIAAYLWIIQHWPTLLRKRRRAQALRAVRDAQLLQLHTFRIEYEQTGAGSITRLAHWVFDPMFYLLGAICRVLIVW